MHIHRVNRRLVFLAQLCLGTSLLFPPLVRGDALGRWTTGVFSSTNNLPVFCERIGVRLQAIAFGNGHFVAIGLYRFSCPSDVPDVAFTSVDGITWCERPFGPDQFSYVNGFAAMTFAAGKFVGVNANGIWPRIATSSNGVDWLSPTPQSTQFLYDVAYGNGAFLVLGEKSSDYSNGYYSSNGISWQSAYWDVPTNYVSRVHSIAFGDGVFAAIAHTNSYSGKFVGPSDLRYSERPITPGYRRFAYYPNGNTNPPALFPSFNDVAFGNGLFVYVGTNILVIPSFAADTNSREAAIFSQPIVPPTTNEIYLIKFLAGTFLALTDTELLTSTDGSIWTNRGSVLPQRISDVTFGAGRFVAVSGTNYFFSEPVTALVAERPAGTFRLSGLTGRNYQIEASDTLTSNSWQVVTNITLTNSPQAWIDPQGTNFQRRFFRTQLLP